MHLATSTLNGSLASFREDFKIGCHRERFHFQISIKQKEVEYKDYKTYKCEEKRVNFMGTLRPSKVIFCASSPNNLIADKICQFPELRTKEKGKALMSKLPGHTILEGSGLKEQSEIKPRKLCNCFLT